MKINKQILFNIHERLIGLQEDIYALDFDAISDFGDVFVYLSRAVNSLSDYCEKNKIELPNLFERLS